MSSILSKTAYVCLPPPTQASDTSLRYFQKRVPKKQAQRFFGRLHVIKFIWAEIASLYQTIEVVVANPDLYATPSYRCATPSDAKSSTVKSRALSWR